MSAQQSIDWGSVKVRLQESQAAIARNLVAIGGQRLEQVYHDRARRFASRSSAVGEPSDTWPALVFAVGDERCCIDTSTVVEVLRYAKCSPVPGAPAALLGVINVRGQIYSVLDLARLLDLPARDDDESPGYIVLVRRARDEVGLMVDEIEQIEMVSSETFGTLDRDAKFRKARFASGTNGRRATIVDVDEVVTRAGRQIVENSFRLPPAAI